MQFITFRLHDSLPKEVIDNYKILTENWKQHDTQDPETKNRQRKLLILIDQHEDNGTGACHLKDPRAASIVRDALLYHSGVKNNLLSWCIMPNHVHVMIQVLNNYSLSEIIHSWKSYSAQKINRLLNLQGPLWMHEYFDRYIRDEKHYHTTLDYILNNPARAGLSDWPWVFGI